ncbi:MAG: Zn-dependent alcohol dehydrogenase [Acidimicrobiales bacterium]
MRAAVLEAVGRPLVVDDVILRPLGPRGVRVRLSATGVCHTDLSLQNGTIPHPVPAVLGHEGAGVVAEVGPEVSTLSVGDHVIVSWIVPCRRCRFCLGGQPVLCERGMDHAFAGPYGAWRGRDVVAALGTATFAEETVVPDGALVRIDRSVPAEVAALIGCGVATGVGAVLNSARVRPGESVAVIGCGGVGLAALQGARLSGASPIVAVDRVSAKLTMATENGATEVVDASAKDAASAVREVTGGVGVDHAFEAVGRADTILAAYAMARRGGTVTIVGAGAFDDPVSFSAMQLMVDAKTVRGCVYGSTDPQRDFPRLVELHQAGAIDVARLVSRRITLDEVNDAFEAMAAGEVARSVIVLPGDGAAPS